VLGFVVVVVGVSFVTLQHLHGLWGHVRHPHFGQLLVAQDALGQGLHHAGQFVGHGLRVGSLTFDGQPVTRRAIPIRHKSCFINTPFDQNRAISKEEELVKFKI
jgi:hypothetical protein